MVIIDFKNCETIMKRSFFFFLSGALAALAMLSCAKEIEQNPEENKDSKPVTIKVSMASETKATLAESGGTFAFSNGDAIKIYDGTDVFSGTTTSTENTGDFEMAAGFNATGSGLAGFPASLVSDITSNGVTFIMPASYEYAAVGGSVANAAKVPCPMMGSYTGAGNEISLKQAGAVIRFRVTNIAAGSLSFTFPTKVTGQVTLASVPEGTNEGILAASLSTAGNTITISDVPAVTSGNYIYITIPVPTATAPQNILVTNTPSNPSLAIRMQSLTGSSAALNRAGGRKLGVSPSEMPTPHFTVNAAGDKVVLAPGNLMAQIASYANGKATASQWKFGEYFETVGNAADAGNYLFATGSDDCVGKWVDLFCWQGASSAVGYRAHGLITNVNGDAVTAEVRGQWFGSEIEEGVYDGCWNGLTISGAGEFTWRLLTKTEWDYILSKRTTSTLNGVPNARNARVTVSGVNGALIFPDNVEEVWNTSTMGAYPSSINQDSETIGHEVAYTWGTDNYTAANMVAMAEVGIIFMPVTGYRSASGLPDETSFTEFGYYWLNTGSPKKQDSKNAAYFRITRLDIELAEYKRWVGRAVRLARDVE